MPARRFPSPWSVEEQPACFVVRDHNGQLGRNRQLVTIVTRQYSHNILMCAERSLAQMTKQLTKIIKRRRIISEYFGGIPHTPIPKKMPKENERRRFDLSPTLFREFATECMGLAGRTFLPHKRALFLEMSSMCQQMAQRWDRNG